MYKNMRFDKEEFNLTEFKPQKTNFLEKKTQIKNLVNESKKNKIETFKPLEIKGLIDRVPVDAFNNQMKDVSKQFVALRNGQSRIYNTLTQIYTTFDELDKTYIDSIVGTIGVLKETTDKLKKNEIQTGKTVVNLRTVVGKLEVFKNEIEDSREKNLKITKEILDFKNELENYKHLNDIDTTVEKLRLLNKEIDELSSIVEKQEETIEYLTKNINTSEKFTQDKILELKKSMREKEAEINNKLQKINSQENLTQKIKNAYFIGVAAGVLAIIELIIILVKVL